MLPELGRHLVDFFPNLWVVAAVSELDPEQPGRPYPEIAARRIGDAEVATEHLEGDGADQRVAEFLLSPNRLNVAVSRAQLT
jgi:hypothetical protein